MRHFLKYCLLGLSVAACGQRSAFSRAMNGAWVEVSQAEILHAMRQEQGYDPTATTNVARFQAGVLLTLVRTMVANGAQSQAIFISHETWFRAFLQRTGLNEARAPMYARLAYEHKQDQRIAYGDGQVVATVEEGQWPELALSVRVSWPRTRALPAQYTFEDTLSHPRLRVTNHRHVSYRLLDFGDMVMYDRIEGLSGRPTSGVLGLLFRVIGEGRVVQAKILASPDGWQISQTRAKKGPFEVNPLVTVMPDGRMRKGLPPDRPDLAALASRLREPLEIKYLPVSGE
ncbi:MAG: hypothetical protein ACE5IY_16270 [bacterium]